MQESRTELSLPGQIKPVSRFSNKAIVDIINVLVL